MGRRNGEEGVLGAIRIEHSFSSWPGARKSIASTTENSVGGLGMDFTKVGSLFLVSVSPLSTRFQLPALPNQPIATCL